MDNKEVLRQKLNQMKTNRTKRDVIIKKMDKSDEKKKNLEIKEEKNIDFNSDLPELEDY